jgi:YjbE family integral membrane protein
MGALLDPEFWARWLSIVVIDLTLAGDNALVIALAVRTLPRKQQLQGRLWGTVGAVVLRLAFIAVATLLLRIPFLQLAGGLLLIWIAVKLVRQPTGGGHGRVREGSSLREAVWIIVVADAVMSLDNVLAVAAAAHGDLLLVVFGIALSLPLVVWGSGLLARLMTRFGWIVWIGGGILGYVAAEMMLADPALKSLVGEALETLDVLPTVLGVTMAGLGWWFAVRAPALPAQSDPGGRHRKGGEAPLRDS